MMTIGAGRSDWLRRVRAEMRGPQEEAAPIVVRFAASDSAAVRRPALTIRPLESLPPASLLPSGVESMMSTLYYAQ